MFLSRLRQLAHHGFRWRTRRLITPYLDGELDRVARARLEQHLDQCALCRAECESLRFASQAVSHFALPNRPPAGMPAWPAAARRSYKITHRRAIRWRILVPMAAAMLGLVIALLLWRTPHRPAEMAWEVVRLSGTPRVDASRMGKTASLNVGQWLETDANSRALLHAGLIGQVEIDPDTRIGLLKAHAQETRLALTHGRMFATITAQPRVFFVETPSGLAIDLGCAYLLEVDDRGASLLRVTSGAVALTFNGRESLVTAGALCQARPGTGPGTPYVETASEKFQQALAALDFDNGGTAALNAVMAEARRDDAMTLWHLLRRMEGADRKRVYERLAGLVPLPDGVTRDGILRLDAPMLSAWAGQIEATRTGNSATPAPVAPGSIQMTGTLETARYAHQATRLADGRVLVTGGLSTGDTSGALASAELYDPTTGRFTNTAGMATKRAAHTAILLTNGKVLITGGSHGERWQSGFASAELYDPATDQFTLTGSMKTARSGHQATLLNDGRVLITGGLGTDAERPWLASAELYDPATGAFTPAGNMSRARADHTATLLTNGQVLIAGGFALQEPQERITSSAELYDPVTGIFTPTGFMIAERFKHSAVLLADGRVLIAGGVESRYPGPQRHYTSAELYDPATGRFTTTGDMIMGRFKIREAAVLLKNGKALIAGGSWGLEIYDPRTQRFSLLVSRLSVTRFYSTATLLDNGDVVIIGGYSSLGANNQLMSNASAWIYHPE
jgi:hypothetical protein